MPRAASYHTRKRQTGTFIGSCVIPILAGDLHWVGDSIGPGDGHADDQVINTILRFGDLYMQFFIHTGQLLGFQDSFSFGFSGGLIYQAHSLFIAGSDHGITPFRQTAHQSRTSGHI